MSEETCFWAIILFFASFFSCRVPSFAWLCPMPNKTTAIPVQHLRRFEDPIVVNSKSQSHSIGVLAFPTLCHDLKCFIRRPNSWTNMTKPMVSSAVCFWLCLYVWNLRLERTMTLACPETIKLHQAKLELYLSQCALLWCPFVYMCVRNQGFQWTEN